MQTLRPDPTFYPSPRSAMQAPPEELAYMVVLNPNGNGRPDALAVLDVDPSSSTYNQVVGRVEMGRGDEVHHFGWNACSAALCPYAPHPHVERRYLLVPGLKSSRIHIVDTKPDPTQPKIVKAIEPHKPHDRTGPPRPGPRYLLVPGRKSSRIHIVDTKPDSTQPKIVKAIEPEQLHERTGYSRPHTFHCGPDGIYVSALGAPDGNGPGGIFVMDHASLEPLGRRGAGRAPQG